MTAIIQAGYPYELVGLLYYVFFLVMGRPRYGARYSRRSRALVLLAAIVLVGCVPFHYADKALGAVAMYVAAALALISTIVDAVAARRA